MGSEGADIAGFLALVRDTRNKLPMNLGRLPHIRSEHNNWVVPGWVMAGPYPGVDGLNFPTLVEACTNLSAILDDGIDVFVSLCSELPPQSEDVAGTAACPAYFPSYTNYAYIIRRSLTCCRPIKYDTLQIVDQAVPSHAELVRLLTRLLGYLRSGKRVFIHCAGGHGRTGTVVACLLMCLYGASGCGSSSASNLADVLHLVQYAHDQRRVQDKRCRGHPIPPRSPNSTMQLEFVRSFSVFLDFALAATHPNAC